MYETETNSPTHAYATIFLSQLDNALEMARKEAKSLKDKVYIERERTAVKRAKRVFERYYYQAIDWDCNHGKIELPEIPDVVLCSECHKKGFPSANED